MEAALYSCQGSYHRANCYSPPCIKLSHALPAGNIHRVVDDKVSSCVAGSISSVNFQACEKLFPVDKSEELFTIRCIYSTSK